MPVNITDQDEFTSPIQAPDDGDPANGATFQLAPQGLANRTRNLHNRVLALEGTPVQYTRILPPSRANGQAPWGYSAIGYMWVASAPNSDTVSYTFHLPHGSILEGVSIGATLSLGTPPNELTLELYRCVRDESGTPGTIAPTQIGATATKTSDGYSELSLPPFSHTVDSDDGFYVIRITARAAVAMIDAPRITFTSSNPAAALLPL